MPSFTDIWEITPETAHERARQLVPEDSFVWDFSDEDSPLGNDIGADTFAAYLDFRQEQPKGKVQDFIANLFDVSVVFIVGLMISLFSIYRMGDLMDPNTEVTMVKTNAQGESEVIVKKGTEIEAYKVTGEQLSGDPSRKELQVRWLSPHSKWSIHSEYQDNLQMLTLFRGGPVVWLSDVDARELEVADNDWVEVFNRNGVVVARAVVSHRVPPGVGMMYHSQDRHVNVPLSELSGTRGGTDNSVTRISLKPTHLIGGYAQLSFGFNYYGPTGTQRDEMVAVRKLQGEVVY